MDNNNNFLTEQQQIIIKPKRVSANYKGQVPRLNPTEWARVKEMWETTPLNGFGWIVDNLQLPLTPNAIRKRANKEKWVKRTSLKKIGENANIKADLVPNSNQNLTLENCELFNIEEAENKRADIIAIHRREWAELRKVHQIGGENEVAKKCLKLDADILKIRQEMERKAWGLDFENLETPVAPPSITIVGV